MVAPPNEPCYVCGAKEKSRFNKYKIGDIPMRYQACIHCTVVTFYLDVDPTSRRSVPLNEVPDDINHKPGK